MNDDFETRETRRRRNIIKAALVIACIAFWIAVYATGTL